METNTIKALKNGKLFKISKSVYLKRNGLQGIEKLQRQKNGTFRVSKIMTLREINSFLKQLNMEKILAYEVE